MRVWADVYDAAGNRQGEGPVMTLKSASVTRVLDGAGSIRLEAPGTDERAVLRLTNEARVRVYVEHLERVREMARGIIREVSYNDSASGYSISPAGVDSLDELKRRTVHYNRQYNNETVAAVVADLVALVPGWTASCDVMTPISVRLDAVSVLKALQSICEMQGIHLRQTPGENVVEVGTFGTDSGLRLLRLLNPAQAHRDLYSNDSVALIESFRLTSSTGAVANRISVLGAGANADSAFSLARCTRTTPYTVIEEAVNGRTLYILEDAASVALYGVIEQDVQIKEIGPLSNNDTDEERAANALYDAAAAWLSRNAVKQDTYRISVKKCTQTVRPGDKVRVVYKGRVERADGTMFVYRDINDDFWVLKATEKVGLEGVSLELEVSNVDRHEEDAARVVLGGLNQIKLQGVSIQPSINHYVVGPEQVLVDASNAGNVELTITDRCFSIDTVLMRVRTGRFKATAKGAAAGGDHRHLMFSYADDAVTLSRRRYFARSYLPGSGSPWNQIYVELYGSTSDIYTYESSGDHMHPMEYGIYRDTSRPAGMTIKVNGETIASGVGTTGADFDETYDVTEAIQGRVGGFRGVHEVTITCTSGQGEVFVTFDVNETITPIRFG